MMLHEACRKGEHRRCLNGHVCSCQCHEDVDPEEQRKRRAAALRKESADASLLGRTTEQQVEDLEQRLADMCRDESAEIRDLKEQVAHLELQLRIEIDNAGRTEPADAPPVQRYDLMTNYRCGSTIEEMERADDGEWVRYEDVAAALLGAPETPALTDDFYIPERDGRRCVEHQTGEHELVCLTCLESTTPGLKVIDAGTTTTDHEKLAAIAKLVGGYSKGDAERTTEPATPLWAIVREVARIVAPKETP